jgi:hypothetical protein
MDASRNEAFSPGGKKCLAGERIQVDHEACGPQNEKCHCDVEMPSLSWEMIPEKKKMRS